jgi:TusA-related sulfurtransferase
MIYRCYSYLYQLINLKIVANFKHYLMSEFVLDLRGTPCPINFIRSKLQLEKMSSGELLEICLDKGEPIEQVPNSLSMEGYNIEGVENKGEYFVLSVRA